MKRMSRNKELKIFGSARPKYWSIQTCTRIMLGIGLIIMIAKETQGYWVPLFAFLMLVHTESQKYLNDIFVYRLKNTVRVSEDQCKKILNDLDRVSNKQFKASKEILDELDRVNEEKPIKIKE